MPDLSAIAQRAREGWCFDDYYYIWFDEADVAALTAAYDIENYFPRYMVVGIRSWDDLILRSNDNAHFIVPSVPIEHEELESVRFSERSMALETDSRFTLGIKWYKCHIVFGGNPDIGENMAWITLEQHVQLVSWWNKHYFEQRKVPAN